METLMIITTVFMLLFSPVDPHQHTYSYDFTTDSMIVSCGHELN